MAKPNKGAKEVKRMRAAARAAAPKVTDTNFAAGAHTRRGEIADEQVGTLDPRQKQRTLAGYPNYEEGSDAKR